MYKGIAKLGVIDSFPESGVNLILVNDLSKGEDTVTPVLSRVPMLEEEVQVATDNDLSPICVVTRSMACFNSCHRETEGDEGSPHITTPGSSPVSILRGADFLDVVIT